MVQRGWIAERRAAYATEIPGQREPEALRQGLAHAERAVRFRPTPAGALELLARYLEERPDRSEYWPDDWWLEPLWDDPRFRRLVGQPPP